VKPRRVTMTVEFAPRVTRKLEHEVGETQAVIKEAIDELTPVALRLAQRNQPLDASAVQGSIMALRQATKHLARLTKYAR
jgi:hypothetical protein